MSLSSSCDAQSKNPCREPESSLLSARLQHPGLLPRRPAAAGIAADLGRTNVGQPPTSRTWRLVLPEDRVAHRIEEAAGSILLTRPPRRRFQFLDAHVGALQRFVLHSA